MKTEIMYATTCALTIYFPKEVDIASADWREQYKTLKDAVNAAEFIFETGYPTAELIVIWDANTGEVLAECSNEKVPEDDWNEEDWEESWGFNEDMGFDPYLGCYTDDC